MNTSTFFKALAAGTVAVATLSAVTLVQAGPGYGPGFGPGMGPGAGFAAARHPGMAAGGGVGWTLMTPEERSAAQAKMAAVKTYEECKAVQAEQHALMSARAAEKGITLPAPSTRGCDMRKARGWFAS
ncbi:MAG: hypothetical protein OHK0048_24540 [Rhodoferax sp.]